MRYFFPIAFILIFTTTAAFGQECTGQWDIYFDTSPLHPKPLQGDTSTGYAVFNFWGSPNLVLELSGEFPRSRFMSFETEATRLAISHDHLFDHAIEPEPGSENPFVEGAALDTTHRSFRVLAMQRKAAGERNTIELPDGRLTQAIMFRIYSPSEGITLSRADLPRVFAYDRATGKPAECPAYAWYDPKFHFPEFLADAYTAIKPFQFKVADDMKIAGLNKAAGYMFAVTPLHRDEVVRIRFRAPTFVQTHDGKGTFSSTSAQVRYWSLCTSDFPKNMSLGCLPDFLSVPDANGDVTVVVGTGDDVRTAALERGASFLPDARGPRQRVMGFVYRNLLPSDAFRASQMYQGAYAPEAVVCAKRAYLAGDCR